MFALRQTREVVGVLNEGRIALGSEWSRSRNARFPFCIGTMKNMTSFLDFYTVMDTLSSMYLVVNRALRTF
jgi:hypothetical protein